MAAGLIAAMTHRSALASFVIRPARLAVSVTPCFAFASLSRECTTHDVCVRVRAGIEEPEANEHGQDDRARKGKRHMVEEETTARVAIRAKRLH